MTCSAILNSFTCTVLSMSSPFFFLLHVQALLPRQDTLVAHTFVTYLSSCVILSVVTRWTFVDIGRRI